MGQTWDARTKLAQEAVDAMVESKPVFTGDNSLLEPDEPHLMWSETQPQAENVTRHVNDNPDSLEIGTPAKGGAVKIYGNFAYPDEFMTKLNHALTIRRNAQALLETE